MECLISASQALNSYLLTDLLDIEDGLEEQDKSSDIKQQPPFGDRK